MEVLAEYDVAGRAPVLAVTASFVMLGALTALLFTGAPKLDAGDAGSEMGSHSLAILDQMPGKVERLLREQGMIEADDEVVAVHAQAGTALVQTADELVTVNLPEGVDPTNVELVGFDLLSAHPGTIEIAGVILLMAMVGATVLARRQSEIEDDAKRRAADAIAARGGLVAPAISPDAGGDIRSGREVR